MRTVLTLVSAIVLLMNFSGCTATEPAMPYSSLVREIKAGNVKHVEIKPGSAVAELKRPLGEGGPDDLFYQITLPHGAETVAELTAMLEEADVAFNMADH